MHMHINYIIIKVTITYTYCKQVLKKQILNFEHACVMIVTSFLTCSYEKA